MVNASTTPRTFAEVAAAVESATYPVASALELIKASLNVGCSTTITLNPHTRKDRIMNDDETTIEDKIPFSGSLDGAPVTGALSLRTEPTVAPNPSSLSESQIARYEQGDAEDEDNPDYAPTPPPHPIKFRNPQLAVGVIPPIDPDEPIPFTTTETSVPIPAMVLKPVNPKTVAITQFGTFFHSAESEDAPEELGGWLDAVQEHIDATSKKNVVLYCYAVEINRA